MTARQSAPWPIVLGSVVVALILTILPLPDGLAPYRPEWLALIVAYWTLLPSGSGFGLGAAWVCGLMLDALTGAVLGQHALALLLLAFLGTRARLRVRVFPLGQQTLTVTLLVAIHEFVVLWVDGMVGHPLDGMSRWWPVLITLLVWPVIVFVLGRQRLSAAN